MTNLIKGNATLYLAEEDASGNVGYSLAFEYEYEESQQSSTIKYINIEFSGPGSWDDYSEGDDFPYRKMFNLVMSKN